MSFRSLLIHRATIRRDPGTSTNDFGESSVDWTSSDLNVATNVPCRLCGESTAQQKGSLEVSTGNVKCLFLRGANILDEDRIIIDSEMYKVIGVDSRYGRIQSRHKSVKLERVK